MRTDQYHVDILAAHFVGRPERFDVVVASNLFGDILSDLGPAVCGTIGIAPSANINPERNYPSLFEPVHGSAPDIAGKGIANPIGQIWSGALMLDFLGHAEAAAAVVTAIERVLRESECAARRPTLAAPAGPSNSVRPLPHRYDTGMRPMRIPDSTRAGTRCLSFRWRRACHC